jgi:potassium-transporting ATPase potassium-binding subunit
VSAAGWIQFVVFCGLIAVSTPLLGIYMYRVYTGQKHVGSRVFDVIDHAIYRVCRIDPDGEQRWNTYAISLLLFSVAGILFMYLLLRVQGHLPLNPDHLPNGGPGLSFNTSISFTTNTDWQVYAGESTMSQLSQMFALVVQMFLSAAVGMAVAVALVRGITRSRRTTLGSFWVDTVRSTTRILLPISFVFAIVFMSQGVVQNFSAAKQVTTVAAVATHQERSSALRQSVIQGPIGSMMPIEELGDNGGGYTNANTAHPYQNPNPFTSILLSWLVVMIPFAFAVTFGKWVGSMRQGAVIFASMFILFLLGLVLIGAFEGPGNPKLKPAGVTQVASAANIGGNLEGKETRFGVSASAIEGDSVTATSAGSPNSAHESYTPLGGAVPLVNILLGEVSPGGAGGGLYGKLILVMLSVFIAGLMVGRTPEYLGKKIQAREMKLAVIYILAVPAAVLGFGAWAIVNPTALAGLSSSGPHGLTEMAYTFASVSNNNGSAFAGITTGTHWYELVLGLAMLIGRYVLIVPVLAIAGSLVRKQPVPATAGTFRTDTPLFLGLLLAVTVILVGLTFFAVVALGPIVEQLVGHF